MELIRSVQLISLKIYISGSLWDIGVAEIDRRIGFGPVAGRSNHAQESLIGSVWHEACGHASSSRLPHEAHERAQMRPR